MFLWFYFRAIRHHQWGKWGFCSSSQPYLASLSSWCTSDKQYLITYPLDQSTHPEGLQNGIQVVDSTPISTITPKSISTKRANLTPHNCTKYLAANPIHCIPITKGLTPSTVKDAYRVCFMTTYFFQQTFVTLETFTLYNKTMHWQEHLANFIIGFIGRSVLLARDLRSYHNLCAY